MGDEKVDPTKIKKQAALKKEIEDFSEKKNREKRLAEQRAWEADIRAAMREEQATAEAREWAAGDPARRKQQAKAEAEVAESRRLNQALVAEGVKAYDSWMTGTLQLIASFVQDARALNATYQPSEKLLNLLMNAPGGLEMLGEMLGDATRSTREGIVDWSGINNNRAIDRGFPLGNIDFSKMWECNEDGCLTITPAIENEEGFEFFRDPENGVLKDAMNAFIKIAIENCLGVGGYECNLDDNTGKEIWTKPSENEPSLSQKLTTANLKDMLEGGVLINTMKKLDEASRKQREAARYIDDPEEAEEGLDDEEDLRNRPGSPRL